MTWCRLKILALSLIPAAVLIWASGVAHASEISTEHGTALTRPWGLRLYLETDSSLKHPSEADYEAETDLYLYPSYRFGSGYKLTGLFVVGQELTGEQELKLARSELTLRRAPMQLNPFLKFTPALTVVPPLAKDRWARESLITTLEVAPRVLFDLTRLGLPQVTGLVELVGERSFHRYTTSTDGKSNQQYALATNLELDLELIPKFTFATLFSRVAGWTYRGSLTHQFQLGEELDYKLTPAFTAVLGIVNGGDTLKANGLDSNIALINGESSQIYGALDYRF